MNRQELMNAFVPAAGIDDPHRFAGRREEIEDLTDALHVEGSIPLIFGQRGLGKSSVALQLTRIAQGDVELLNELELTHLALMEEQQFLTFYVMCTDATKNLAGILSAIVNAMETAKHVRSRDRDARYQLVDKKTRRKLSIKFFELEDTKSYQARVEELDTSRFSLEERVIHLAEALTDSFGQPVLIVLDELDRIGPVRGLSSFLKAASGPLLKFVLVGIGTNYGELLRDHASLNRQLVAVKVPRMTKAELESIVERTEEYLAEKGEAFEFTPAFSEGAAKIASGFPWFVHVIGQAALVAATRDGRRLIGATQLDTAVQALATKRFARQYYDTYLTAVRDSSHREYVLRLFAMWRDEDVPTSAIYPHARHLGVSNPSTYLGHLTRTECGQVLARSPQQARALYRFTDEMFKVYVRARESLYEGIKDEVEALGL